MAVWMCACAGVSESHVQQQKKKTSYAHTHMHEAKDRHFRMQEHTPHIMDMFKHRDLEECRCLCEMGINWNCAYTFFLFLFLFFTKLSEHFDLLFHCVIANVNGHLWKKLDGYGICRYIY